MPGPEARIERYLTSSVRARGGHCFKLAPTTAGLPDRLVVLPPGRLLLVELKAPGGRLRPVQVALHERLSAAGVEVAVLASKTQIDNWLRDMIY